MFFSKKCKVIIKNRNITIEAKSGSNLFNILKDNDIMLPSLCGGDGQCGKCKVRIISPDGREIQKPTKKDRLVLALINIDAGYRLACQYVIKGDIIVDTEEWITTKDSVHEIVHINVKPAPKSQPDIKSEIQDELRQNGTIKDILDDSRENKVEKILVSKDEDLDYRIGDGLILIQYPKGVKYYFFSAAIENISHEGFIKCHEPLFEIIDNNAVSDFIHENIKIPDVSRIIFILDSKHYEGTVIWGIANYYSFELGTLLCEIIQPESNPRLLTSFFRLTNNLKENTLILSLDSLGNIYYVNAEGDIENLDLSYISDEGNIADIFSLPGKNPIVGVSDNLTQVEIKEPFIDPDSISASIKLKAVVSMIEQGVVKSNFSFGERQSLIDKVPLEILIKLSQKNGKKLFYLYRKKNTEIYIDEMYLEKLKNFRILLNSLISYIEKNMGKISFIAVNSFVNYENITNYLLSLGIFPQRFSKKIKFFSGDPTVLATKFFSYTDILSYLNQRIPNISRIELYKDNSFNEIYERVRKETI